MPTRFAFYDFGDGWQHDIVVTGLLPATADSPKVAFCIEGGGACPPEDCGGLWGYANLQKILKNKRHEEHRRMREWLGRPFDPEFFSAQRTNAWLRKLKWPNVTDNQLCKILMGRDGYTE